MSDIAKNGDEAILKTQKETIADESLLAESVDQTTPTVEKAEQVQEKPLAIIAKSGANCGKEDKSTTLDRPSEALVEISKRIAAFLDTSLCSGHPDFAEAKQIMSDLLSAIDFTEPKYSSDKILLIRHATEMLQPDPHKWPEALRLASLYFRNADTEAPHPMADKNIQQRNADGRQLYSVDIELINPLTLQLLKQASKEVLIKFVKSASDWEVLGALTRCIPMLEIDADTFAIVIHHADTTARNDMFWGKIMEPLGTWVQAHPNDAMAVVDNWHARHGTTRELSHASIFFIVRALARKADAALMDWRNRIIEKLNKNNDGDSWSLAVQLACFAWPEGTPSEVRHEEMVSYVKRLPERLVDPGLRALSFDAREDSEASVKTSLSLLRLLSDKPVSRIQAHPALVFAEVMRSVAWARKGMPILPPTLLDETLAALLHVPLGKDHSPLDAFLAELIKTEPTLVNEFLAQWVVRHGKELVDRGDSLAEVFPLLPTELVNQWLISFMVHKDSRLRSIAVRLWNNETDLTLDMLTALSKTQLQALMHQLAGSMSSATYVPLIVRIGGLRPECMPTALEILLNDAIGNCSETCSESIDLYWKPSDVDAIQAAYKLIQSKLDEHRTAWGKRLTIPEIRTSWNSYVLFAELFNRQFQKSMHDYRASGKALFTQIATTINIVYGSKSISPHNPKQEIEFSTYSSKVYEQPILEVIDKIGELRKRKEHLEKTVELLSKEEVK